MDGLFDSKIIPVNENCDWVQLWRGISTTERDQVGGILVICPHNSHLDAFPGPCVDGIPVGMLPASGGGEITPWLDALRKTSRRSTHVLAMWKPFYLGWGERFVAALQAGYGRSEAPVVAQFADTTTKEDLCASLWKGPQLVIYLGHGRSRGWSGYRGLRWHHIASGEQVQPVGTLIALTCDNLKPGRSGETAFGLRWVMEGRAKTFLGAIQEVEITAMEVIAEYLLGHFSDGRCRLLGELIAAVDRDVQLSGEAAIQKNWSYFRLVGNPLEVL